jgi:hypothetical protein
MDEGERGACNRGSCRPHRPGRLRKHEQARTRAARQPGGRRLDQPRADAGRSVRRLGRQHGWVFGGYSFSAGQNLDTFYKYEWFVDYWTQLASMSDAHLMSSAVPYGAQLM